MPDPEILKVTVIIAGKERTVIWDFPKVTNIDWNVRYDERDMRDAFMIKEPRIETVDLGFTPLKDEHTGITHTMEVLENPPKGEN